MRTPNRSRAKLWPYQEVGAAFLAQRAGAFLFDEMGIGKSAQAVVAADHVGASRRLVLCPATARENWRREVHKFSAEQRSVDVAYSGAHVFSHLADTWVVNYDLVRDPRIKRQLRAWAPQVVLIDEAHYLKSLEAQRTQAVLGATGTRKGGVIEAAQHVWGLTGTPIPNNVLELYPLLRAITPDALAPAPGYPPMTESQFSQRFAQTNEGPYGTRVSDLRNVTDLRQRLSRVALRRRAEDVLKDLPPFRVEVTALSSPSAVAALQKAQDATPGIEALMQVLSGVAMDPVEIDAALSAAEPHMAALRRITGTLKAPLVADEVADMLEGGLAKVVVMAVHRDAIDVLQKRLARYKPQVLHGGTSPTAKQQAIDTFQRDPKARVFIGNIVAAGTAITLTAAADLVFAETSWVPSDNAQAAKRVHRIGQTKPVLVRIPTLMGTIDELVARVVRRKTKHIAAVLN